MKSLKQNTTVILVILSIGTAGGASIVWAADQRYMQISTYRAISKEQRLLAINDKNEQRLMALDDKLKELRLKIKFDPPSKVNQALFDDYIAERETLFRKINGGNK